MKDFFARCRIDRNDSLLIDEQTAGGLFISTWNSVEGGRKTLVLSARDSARLYKTLASKYGPKKLAKKAAKRKARR